MTFRALLSVLVALATGAASRAASAEDVPTAELPVRDAKLSYEKDLLTASFSYRDLIDPKTAVQLSSGMPVTLSLRAYVLRDGESDPIALAVRSCRVVYDLWDEVYKIRIVAPETKAPAPVGLRTVTALSTESVLRQCVEAKALPIVHRRVLVPNAHYFLGILAEVNPMNAKNLEEMQRWVTRLPGATGIGPGDALFGTFALLFVHELDDADRTLRFRTRAFVAQAGGDRVKE